MNWERLFELAKQQNIPMPIQFGIGVQRVTNQGMTRYMRVYVGSMEVTSMIAAGLGRKVSKERGSGNGCLIVKGCGMDMAFDLQNRIHCLAKRQGLGQYIDSANYRYVQLRK